MRWRCVQQSASGGGVLCGQAGGQSRLGDSFRVVGGACCGGLGDVVAGTGVLTHQGRHGQHTARRAGGFQVLRSGACGRLHIGSGH